MAAIKKTLNALAKERSELVLFGHITEEVSREIIKIDDGYKFSHALITKLLGENILESFIDANSRLARKPSSLGCQLYDLLAIAP